MSILKYGVLRLAIFFATFALCVWLGTGWLWACVVAVVISFGVSYLFLNPVRLAAGKELADAWQGRRTERGKQEQSDMDVEDAYTQGRFLDPHELRELDESIKDTAADDKDADR